MLKQIFTKAILSLSALMIIVGSLFILSMKHRDTLKYLVPQETTVYLHLEKANQLSRLSKNHKLLMDNLVQFEDRNLNVFGLAELIGESELAIFKTNKHPFMLATYSTPSILDYLDRYGVNYSGNRVIYFPTSQKITPLPLGIKVKQKLFDFSDINIYFSGDEPLVFGNVNTSNIKTGPLFAKVNIDNINETLHIETTLSTPVVDTKNLLMSQGLPANAEIYLTSANLSLAPLTANLIEEHFDYILLQKVSQPIEYLKTAESSLFNFGTTYSKDQIMDMVKFTLATLSPKEVTHALPDGSSATNLVVDPTRWSFEGVAGDVEGYELVDESLNLNLYLTKDGNNWVLTKGVGLETLLAVPKEDQTRDNCTQEGITPSQVKISHYSSETTISFYQRKSNTLSICLH